MALTTVSSPRRTKNPIRASLLSVKVVKIVIVAFIKSVNAEKSTAADTKGVEITNKAVKIISILNIFEILFIFLCFHRSYFINGDYCIYSYLLQENNY